MQAIVTSPRRMFVTLSHAVSDSKNVDTFVLPEVSVGIHPIVGRNTTLIAKRVPLAYENASASKTSMATEISMVIVPADATSAFACGIHLLMRREIRHALN
jgi:hypothetical protein